MTDTNDTTTIQTDHGDVNLVWEAPTPDALGELVKDATDTDGIGPLDEQTMLNARRAHPDVDDVEQNEARSVTHLSVFAEGLLVGYAQSTGATAELVVHPSWRRQGLGSTLLNAMTNGATSAEDRPAVWAHGNLEAARTLATSAGLQPVRTLFRLGLPIRPQETESDESAEAERALVPPDGVVLEQISTDRDEDDWLALNAEAFASHPEQGSMTSADLAERKAEDWFNPAYFLIAREAGPTTAATPLASLWLKVEPGSQIMELYVLAVSPLAQGSGLGRWLTDVAIDKARQGGFSRIDLYVDDENTAAVGLYRSAGFGTVEEHVQYR